MTYYMKSGSTYNVSAKAALDISETLPAETFTVKWDDMRGVFYLEETEGFEVTGKIYGKTTRHAERILETFKQRPNSTGVMLSGEQGSGKTMLAKILGIEGRKLGYPTIVINEPHTGEIFNTFMQMIEQPVIVIFDEFEKVYDSEKQEKLLTLFDGVYPSKKLFIITCNNRYRVNEHMSNRPGRIYYRLNYTGLDADFIREYCVDNLQDKTQTDEIVRVSHMFSEFNFDVLKAMVEEMNRYNESPLEVMEMLNAKPEYGEGSKYTQSLTLADGTQVQKFVNKVWQGNPFSNSIEIGYLSGERWEYALFEPTDMVYGEREDDSSVLFKNDAGEVLTLNKQKSSSFRLPTEAIW